jgi:hypothetical protein
MSVYEEIEIEDMVFDAAKQAYTYPCPCGDRYLTNGNMLIMTVWYAIDL